MVIPQFILSMFFLALGFAMVKFPPRRINPWYGYRSQASMKSQEAWDYAQRMCSRKIVLIGIVMLALALVEWLVGLPSVWCAFILIASPLIAFPYLISVIERQLKRRFSSSVAPSGEGPLKGSK
jgi:uncharacterized membrane protein